MSDRVIVRPNVSRVTVRESTSSITVASVGARGPVGPEGPQGPVGPPGPLAHSNDGWADYNNAGGPITVLAGEWTALENDGAGAFSNTTYLPPGVSRLLDTATGAIDFAELALGDEVQIRQDVNVRPSVNGSQVEMRIKLGVGAGTYYLTHSTAALNQGGGVDYPLIQLLHIYMGDTNTLANPGVIQIRCTEDATITNNGSYITVRRRAS